jgi:hypothetical protein
MICWHLPLGGEGAVITIDVRHDGLGRLARVSAPAKDLAERRAAALRESWDGIFQRREQLARALSAGGYTAVQQLEAGERAREIDTALSALGAILPQALAVIDAGAWVAPPDTSAFAEAVPQEPSLPVIEIEPMPEDFPPAALSLALLLKPRALFRRHRDARLRFRAAHTEWAHLKAWRDQEYSKAYDAYKAALAGYERRKTAFQAAQARANAALQAAHAAYQKGDSEGVLARLHHGLLLLERPEGFPCYWAAKLEGGLLHLDYELPGLEAIPLLKAVKYVPARSSYTMSLLSEEERWQLYGEAVFQTVLAVFGVLFKADTVGHIRAIAFQGWANSLDSVPVRALMLGVGAERARFAGLDLVRGDPKSLLRALGASMSPKLAALEG